MSRCGWARRVRMPSQLPYVFSFPRLRSCAGCRFIACRPSVGHFDFRTDLGREPPQRLFPGFRIVEAVMLVRDNLPPAAAGLAQLFTFPEQTGKAPCRERG